MYFYYGLIYVKIKTGKGSNSTVEILKKIAKALDVPIEDLIK